MSDLPECYGQFLGGNIAAERDCPHCPSNEGCYMNTAMANKIIGPGGEVKAVKLDTGKRKLSLIHPSVFVLMLTAKTKRDERIKDAMYHLSLAAHPKDESDFAAYSLQALTDIVCYLESEKVALEMMTLAMEYGANKPEYGRNNWKKGMEWSRLVDAGLRHGLAILEGEEIDQDSGNPHVAHMLASIHMLLGNHALNVGTNDLY